MSHSAHRRTPAKRWLAGLSTLALVGVGMTIAPEAASASTITSAGPLTRVDITPDLNCAVNHTGDTDGEWYGDTACGTLLASGGTLYGPESIPAGNSASPRTTWTMVSQSAVTGSGTNANPYKIVTVVSGGTFRLTQTDTYVVGEESYQTSIDVKNTGTSAKNAVLYRAGDCYLQNSDFGYGRYDASTGAVTCAAGTDSSSRIEQMYPLTAGSNYLEDFYDTMWQAVGSQQPLPNTCRCSDYIDNAIALSWSLSVPAGATKTVSSFVTFSPLGHQPLTLTKTADASTVQAQGTDGYTITATNPNSVAVTLSSLTDTLGAGFTYIAGSTTGATTADPSINGQALTWSNIVVPANGSTSLHFQVTAPNTAGTFTDNATGDANGYTVAGTGDTAPVTVVCPTASPTIDAHKFVDAASASSISATGVSTGTAKELVLAAVEAGGPVGQAVTSVTGAGLTWKLAKRSHANGGTTEIWFAHTSAKLSSATVKATLAVAGYHASLSVVSFRNGKGIGTTSGASGSASVPSTAVTPKASNSVVWAAAHGWGTTASATAASGQAIAHQYADTAGKATFWTQFVSAPTSMGHTIVVTDSNPSGGAWSIAAVEVLGASVCPTS